MWVADAMRRSALAAGAAVAVLCALPVGAQDKPAPVRQQAIRPRTLAEDLQLFSQVLNQIRVNHTDSVDTHALIVSAIEGMVGAADPHSYVIPAMRLDADRHSAWLAGKLHPVALDFQWMDGAPLVIAIAPGSKASRLDVLVGDELIAIDGAPVSVRSPAELAYTLAGPKGTSVKLSFDRRRSDGSVVRLERVLPREKLDERTEVWGTMLDARTGYVRLLSFSTDKVADALNDRVSQLEKAGMERLILDLRDNGGGRIDQASDVAAAFLPRGSKVYSISGAKKEVADTGVVKRAFWKEERRYPLVVMVNSGTASASELVAAALQEHDRALLAGRTTFGKALVMMTVPLTDGSLMVLSVGRVSTPCGRVIQREYRGVSRRSYLRTAGAAMDTAGRPSCRTTAGRTVYGGSGVIPDVVIPEEDRPAWLTRLAETDALLTWSAGHASSGTLGTLDGFAGTPALPESALADFRAFASSRGIAVPTDSASSERLNRSLVRAVAYAKWADEGLQLLSTRTDPEIRAAALAFEKVNEIIGNRGKPQE